MTSVPGMTAGPGTTAGPVGASRAVPTLEVERALLAQCAPARPGTSVGGPRLDRVVGIDEVGRGALAGPVMVGAAVVDADCGSVPDGLRDSKLLSPAARDCLVAPIRSWAIECAVGEASAAEIDQMGIMGALRLAARRALAALSSPVWTVLLDGNVDYLSSRGEPDLFESARGGDHVIPGGSGDHVIPGGGGDHVIPDGGGWQVHTRIKADRDCASVAAASVIAKTTRDALMVRLAERYPAYGWERNKGYGTAAHAAAILSGGRCEWHRRSWRMPVAAGQDRGVGHDEQV